MTMLYDTPEAGVFEGLTRLWGSLASCAPVGYRRNWRVANPPQVDNLPH